MAINPIFRWLNVDPRHWRFRFWQPGTLEHRLNRAYGMARTSRPWQRATVQLGRALNWIRPRNFLILTAVRSGTSLLVDYLNCHPRIRCRSEILNPSFSSYGNPRAMSAERLRLHVESLFIKRPGMMAGAKVMTFQLDEMPIKLTDLLKVLSDPAVIVLYRQDTLAQLVSLKSAERDQVWHSGKPVPKEPISLDPEVLVAFAERERRMWRESLAQLDGSRVHYVTYEGLTGQTEATLGGIFEFLGLEPRPVDSPLVKLSSAPLSRRLVNYPEFRRAEIAQHSHLQLPPSNALPAERVA